MVPPHISPESKEENLCGLRCLDQTRYGIGLICIVSGHRMTLTCHLRHADAMSSIKTAFIHINSMM